MDDGGSATLGIVIFAILLLFDFVIFGFLAAMRNLNESAVEKMAEEGDAKAKLLLDYLDKPERYTRICQLLILAAQLTAGFAWAKTVTVSFFYLVLFFVLLAFVVLIFGIYTPDKVASRKPELWARRFAYPMHALEVVFGPLIGFADLIANLPARAFGVDPLAGTDDVTEEEIISMVNEGHEQGMLLASEAEMIHNIFEFGDKEAKDIMVHRKNMITIDGSTTFYNALEIMKENNFSRFPVYHENIDNITGILHIKDALDRSLDQSLYGRPISEIDGLIRDVSFIPETRNINTLFSMMQRTKTHMVVVVDEYGQTSGIVAMEDIIEEIVGNIEDEHDEEQTMIVTLPDGSYRIDGMAPFDEVTKLLDLEPEDADEYDTLNGFLISLIDRIPNEDERISVDAFGYRFEIESVENKMIKSVRAFAAQPSGEESSQDAEAVPV